MGSGLALEALPFAAGTFRLVMGSCGLFQSPLTDRDLARALGEARRVLGSGGRLGVDLVPVLPRWPVYRGDVRRSGRARGGARVTLVESVRQDRARGLTIFDGRFVETRGRSAASTASPWRSGRRRPTR
jgi:hypothetical protein